VTIEVRTRLAAIRSVTTPQDLRRTISRSLGIIWPTVHDQGVRFGTTSLSTVMASQKR
jgi:hypothetical protein